MEGSMWRLTQSISFLNICSASLRISRREVSNKALCNKFKLPDKPKKPTSPFFKYINSLRVELLKEDPNMKMKEITMEAAKRWNALSEKEKQRLSEQYKIEYQKFRDKLIEYQSNFSKEQMEEFDDADKDLQFIKQKKLLKLVKIKKGKELNKPKIPLTPFFRYLHSENKKGGGMSSNFIKQMAQKWKELSPEVKQSYKDSYEKEFVEYKKALSAWEEEMIRLGHMDVVSCTTLKAHLKTFRNK